MQFYYMAKGEDTMLSENYREDTTVSDRLQVGKNTNTVDGEIPENEANGLQTQAAEVCLQWHACR